MLKLYPQSAGGTPDAANPQARSAGEACGDCSPGGATAWRDWRKNRAHGARDL